MQALKTPNVYRAEKDQSEVTAPVGTSIGAIVMSARQGVVNQRVLVTNDKQLIDLFGNPIPDGEDVGIYAGMEFLKESDSLYVVRGTSGSEQYANIVVSGSGVLVSASNGQSVIAQKTSDLLVDAPDGNTDTAIYDVDNKTVNGGKILIACKGPGTYGNNIGITVVTSATASDAILSASCDWLSKYDASISGSVFKISVFVKTSEETSFPTSPEETFYVSRQYAKDGEGRQLFVDDVINGKSQYIYVVNQGTDVAVPGQVFISGASMTPVALSGGLDSSSTFNISTGQNQAGWGLFTDRTKVSVNILLDTMKVSTTSAPIVANVAASRLDCIACVQAGIDVSGSSTAIISSFPSGMTIPSYASVYGGWDMIYDSFNDRNVYIPKCVYGAVLMARTDRVANTWDAPAGMNRGILPSIGQGVRFNDTEIGNMYDANINTSRFIKGVGNVMWGQKTAQKKKSALDRINVRRLFLYIENSVEPSLLPFLFEPNTDKVRLRAFSIVDDFMKGVLAGGGVTKYEVVCDETNNTAQTIDNNELILDVYVQPTKTIEFIRLNIIVTRTGVNFAEIR